MFKPGSYYHSKYLRLFCFTCLVVLSSCEWGQQNTNHEAYFKKAVHQAYHMPNDKVLARAVPYVDSVYSNFKGHITPGDLLQKYDFKCNFYLYYADNNVLAMQYADSMLYVLKPYYNDKKFNFYYSTACLNKGNVLYKQKYYSSAYHWYYLGKSSLYTGDSCSYNKYMSKFNSSLAMVSYDQGKYKQAIRFWHAALNKMTCENGYDVFYLKQGLYDNIGLCYRNLQRPDDAIKYFDKALTIIKANLKVYPDKYVFMQIAYGLVLGNRGDAYQQKALYQQAEKDYLQSAAINSQKNYLIGDARLTRLKLADMYVKQLRFKSAKEQLDSVKPILDEKYRPEMLRWLYTNAEYYRNMPNSDASKAYGYLSRYVSLKDSVQADQRVLAGADFNDDFNVLQQEYELKSESKKNRLYNLLMYSFLLLLVLMVAFTGSYLVRKGLGSQKANGDRATGEHSEKEVYLNWFDEL